MSNERRSEESPSGSALSGVQVVSPNQPGSIESQMVNAINATMAIAIKMTANMNQMAAKMNEIMARGNQNTAIMIELIVKTNQLTDEVVSLRDEKAVLQQKIELLEGQQGGEHGR
ncbi:hypothetical protein ACHAQD_006997 [Fusarium lateritium]